MAACVYSAQVAYFNEKQMNVLLSVNESDKRVSLLLSLTKIDSRNVIAALKGKNELHTELIINTNLATHSRLFLSRLNALLARITSTEQ